MIGEGWGYWGSHGQALLREILRVREDYLAKIAEAQGETQDPGELESDIYDEMDIDEDEGVGVGAAGPLDGERIGAQRPRLIIRIPPRQPAHFEVDAVE